MEDEELEAPLLVPTELLSEEPPGLLDSSLELPLDEGGLFDEDESPEEDALCETSGQPLSSTDSSPDLSEQLELSELSAF